MFRDVRRPDQPNGRDQPLLGPVRLGGLALPNRVVMAPMTRARAAGPGRVPTDLHAAYYAQRATAGLIVAEGAWVSEGAVGFPRVPGIYAEAQVEAWRRVTGVVHALGGRIVLQLWHAGAHSHPDHLGGGRPAGPSPVNPGETCRTGAGPRPTVTPREMTSADIDRTVAEYAAAAANARRAGFDGVEVAANGAYLLAQFLNPRLNVRRDGYGADRARLPLEVVDAVAAAWDPARTGVRLSPWWTAADAHRPAEGYPYTADEATLARYDDLVGELERRGPAYLHLRGRALPRPGAVPDFAEFARFRGLFGGPLIANHGFGRESGNAVVEAGIADAVSFASPFIANPDLVARFALGVEPASDDPGTRYGGGPRGYVDYPIWPG
ncbi:alkene reductase [Actinomadura syzygii]|uniref:Alkene reductase n=1 Tax=Actinomadura syzygii TaxID=1427538 RepID=A0A5D0UDU8_9ACTN|nr:alkene reductase [Actinomadura syzygii]TYC16568.1 alkene reductase [Actinomadura syzygii]